MKKGVFIGVLVVGIFVLLASVSVYATTRITDNQITAQNFNMSGGRFNQESKILSQVGYIKDDNQGGEAHYLDGPRGVFVQGKYAYTLSREEDAFCIFDVYNPSNITEISCIRDNSSGGKAHYLDGPTGVFVQGKYAYVTARYDNSLSVFDISNPSNITEVNYIFSTCIDDPSLAKGIYISGKYAYILSRGSSSFSVFDISDPTNITQISCVKDDSKGGDAVMLESPRNFFILGDYAYIVSMYKSGAGNDSLSIFDISNPSNITEVGYIEDDSNGGTATVMEGTKDVYIGGNYAYVLSTIDDAIDVIDISNKSNPVEVNYIQDDSHGGKAHYLNGANYIAGAGDYLYVTASSLVTGEEDSLSVFDISNPYDIKEVQYVLDSSQGGSFSGLHNPRDIFLVGNKLYITADADDSLSIIEISGVKTPSVKTGTLEATLIDVLGNLRVLRDVYIGNGLNVAGTGLFSSGLSVMKSLEVFGNFTINNHQGITGNYSNGNCWTAYSGGIIYETNCTSN